MEIERFFRNKFREISHLLSSQENIGGLELATFDAVWEPSDLSLWAVFYLQFLGKNKVVCELGFGDGRVLKLLETIFEVKEAIGYEANPILARWVKDNVRWDHPDIVRLIEGDYTQGGIAGVDLYVCWPAKPRLVCDIMPIGTRVALYHTEPDQELDAIIDRLPFRRIGGIKVISDVHEGDIYSHKIDLLERINRR